MEINPKIVISYKVDSDRFCENEENDIVIAFNLELNLECEELKMKYEDRFSFQLDTQEGLCIEDKQAFYGGEYRKIEEDPIIPDCEYNNGFTIHFSTFRGCLVSAIKKLEMKYEKELKEHSVNLKAFIKQAGHEHFLYE